MAAHGHNLRLAVALALVKFKAENAEASNNLQAQADALEMELCCLKEDLRIFNERGGIYLLERLPPIKQVEEELLAAPANLDLVVAMVDGKNALNAVCEGRFLKNVKVYFRLMDLTYGCNGRLFQFMKELHGEMLMVIDFLHDLLGDLLSHSPTDQFSLYIHYAADYIAYMIENDGGMDMEKANIIEKLIARLCNNVLSSTDDEFSVQCNQAQAEDHIKANIGFWSRKVIVQLSLSASIGQKVLLFLFKDASMAAMSSVAECFGFKDNKTMDICHICNILHLVNHILETHSTTWADQHKIDSNLLQAWVMEHLRLKNSLEAISELIPGNDIIQLGEEVAKRVTQYLKLISVRND